MTGERHRRQRFRDSIAESLLRPDLAIGWDRGRRHQASIDQYVPFTAHVAEPDGTTTAIGVLLPGETAWIDVERVGDLEFTVRAAGRDGSVGLRVVGASSSDLAGDVITTGRTTIRLDTAPTTAIDVISHGTTEVHLTWPQSGIEARVTISRHSPRDSDGTDPDSLAAEAFA